MVLKWDVIMCKKYKRKKLTVGQFQMDWLNGYL